MAVPMVTIGDLRKENKYKTAVEKIRSAELIGVLEGFAFNEELEAPERTRAAQILLNKTIPDLKSTEIVQYNPVAEVSLEEQSVMMQALLEFRQAGMKVVGVFGGEVPNGDT